MSTEDTAEYTQEQLASLAKNRPANESEKRFVLSKEEFSRNRLEALKDGVREIKEEHPEVLSFCMFGSMVKGTAHEGSDIDGYLYIDSELAAKEKGTVENRILLTGANGTDFSKEAGEQYARELKDLLMEKSGLGAEGVKDIRSMPISSSVIAHEIDSVFAYYRASGQYDHDWDAWLDKKPERGADIDALLEYQRS